MSMNDEANLDEQEVIVLQDEDGNEHNFVLGEVLTVDGQDYAVLLPIDDDLEEGVIFRVEDGEGDELVLTDIESDEEFERVVAVYNEAFDEE